MLRALRLHSWDVFAYELLSNQLRALRLLLGQFSSGQRQPITLRLQLVFLGRFRIRVVAQSAAPCGLASWTAQQRSTSANHAARFALALLGRFRIRAVAQSPASFGLDSWTAQQRSTSANHTARFALAFLGRFRIRAVAQSAAPCELASWTTQQDYTRCRLGSQGTKLHIVVYPQEKHPLSTGGKGCFRKIFKAFGRGEKFF